MILIMLMQSAGRSWTWLLLLVVLLLCCAPMLWMMLRGRRGRDLDGSHDRNDDKRS